jgi:hypothetical protein
VVLSRTSRSIVDCGQLTERPEGGEMSKLFVVTPVRSVPSGTITDFISGLSL